MYRRHAPPRLFLSALILTTVLISGFLAGCNNSDPVDPVGNPPSAGAGPVLDSEPAFSPGNTNTISWSFPARGKTESEVWEFLVQRSGDPLFADEVVESDWIPDSSYEFTDLEHGSIHYYRVLGKNSRGEKTKWSASQTSVQDSVAPVAVVAELKTEQTSLLFTFELSATEQTSGIREIELWFGVDGAQASLFGTFQPGLISFQATRGGPHEFFPVAIDGAGNRQDAGTAPAGATLVPEPIIITDQKGEDFDITSAVLEFRMGVDFWEYGLGRFTIRPIIDPRMLEPGDFGYPSDDNVAEVLGVHYEDDIRAYKIGDLTNREVVDDVVNGVPIAVSY